MRLSAGRQDRKPSANPFCIAGAATILLLICLPCSALADEVSEFARARAAATSGQLFEAQSLLEALIEEYPDGKRVLEATYLLGQVLYRRADYAAAAETFSAIIDEHPGWKYADEATYGMAMAQIGMREYAAAIQTLELLQASYPESEFAAEALYWLGEALYRRGSYADAREHFDQFLATYPDHALREYALDAAASCLEESGNHFSAIGFRQRLLNEFPDTLLKARAEFCLATDYLKAGNPYAAARHYIRTESANPASPLSEEALLRAGILLSEAAQPGDSIRILEKLLAREPAEGIAKTARLALARCYLRNGNYATTERMLRGLFKKPLSESERCAVFFQLALAQVGLEKFDAAAARFAVLLRRDTCASLKNPSALLLATCLLNLDRANASAEALHSFLQAMPTSERPPNLRFALAGSLILSHRFAEAQPILAVLAKDEDSLARWPQVIYYDGLCLFWMSEYDRASRRFGQFIKAGKSEELLPLAVYMKANSLMRGGKLAEATVYYDRFLEKWGNELMPVSALYQNGLANLILHRYSTAATLLERVITDFSSAPAAAPARYFLGISRMKMRDAEGATDLFRFLSDTSPTFELSDRAAFAYGCIEFARADYAAAGTIFKQLPSRFPQTELGDAATFFSAASDYRLGLPEMAAIGFRKVPALFPKSPLTGQALLWAGKCEEELNRSESALALYKRAFKSSDRPDERAFSLYSIGWSHMNLSDRDAAAEVFGELIDEYPRDSVVEQAYYWKGRLDYADGRWKAALETLLELTRVFPTSELADDAFFFAARAARKSADYDRAIDLFRLLDRRFPASPFVEQASIEVAECMIDAGMADEAVREFEEFIANHVDSPLRPFALYMMGKALQRAGKFEEANEQYRVAAAGEKTELAARSNFAIAECLAELDRSGEAIAELIGIAHGGFPAGWAERAQLQMARLLERDGQLEEARLIYGSIAATYSDDAAGMVALKAIEKLDADRKGVAVP